MAHDLNRRAFFRRSGASGLTLALTLAGGKAAAQGSLDSVGGLGSAGSSGPLGKWDAEHHYITRPDLHPPQLTVLRSDTATPGYVFMGPKQPGAPGGGPGCLIVDDAGEPVWIHPGGADEYVMNFRPHTYQDQRVLAWWHGDVPYGHGYGSVTVVDDHYRAIAEVHASDGEQADLHEVTITNENTMLMTAYSTRRADLRGVGGPSDGWVFEGVVQEVDIMTGAMIMEWRSLDAVPVDQSYFPLGDSGAKNAPYDYFHINSINVAPDGNLIISARHTCTVYKIARDGSAVLWHMGAHPRTSTCPMTRASPGSTMPCPTRTARCRCSTTTSARRRVRSWMRSRTPCPRADSS